jgi:hypothetical protein
MSYFITTHVAPPWEIPFKHMEIGVEGYIPAKGEGIAAGSIISRLLDMETAFGALRGVMAINSVIDKLPEDEAIFVGSYRLMLSQEIQDNWISPVMQENKIISPAVLAENWQEIIAVELPADIDLLIPAPRLLPDTILGQYSRVHHLDDLLLAVGCAIRAGLILPLSLPRMLESNTLIPYGNFASNKKIRFDFNERLWWCVQDFYKRYYIPRVGYQRRVIDFVFERVASMAIMQMVVNKQLRCKSARSVWISLDGTYEQGH